MRSFRLACHPSHVPLVDELLQAQGYAFEPEPFDPRYARRLTREPRALGDSVAATFGLIYIQDRSSMLPPLMLAPQRGETVLDMCASPGGKSGLAARLAGPDGFVLANEPGRDRLATLRQNLRRQNIFSAATCGYDGQRLPLTPESFGAILLDPPCSGWGTVEKNPKVLSVWRVDKVDPLVRLQRELLVTALALLAPGGRLLYSTCTTNVAENEAQIAWALETHGLQGITLEPLTAPPGFFFEEPELGLSGVLRVDMARSASQGFFLACLRKAGSADDQDPASVPESHLIGPGEELRREDLAACGLDPELLPAGRIHNFGGLAYFLPQASLLLSPELRWQGYCLGKVQGGRIHPWPRLRGLVPLNAEGVSLEDPAAVASLLAGRSIDRTSDAPLVPLLYKNMPLGLLTRKGNRLIWSDR